MTGIRTGLVAAAVAAGLAAPAIACPPPPPPPAPPAAPAGTPEADARALADGWNLAQRALSYVQDRDRQLEQQVGLFDRAGGLVLARVESEGRTSGYPEEFAYMNNMPLVMMKPVRWVKGAGGSEAFQLAETNLMSCGYGAVDAAVRGQVGDVLLVYLDGAELRQDNVLFVLPVSRIIEPRALALLTKE
jgi:hypothetical protein